MHCVDLEGGGHGHSNTAVSSGRVVVSTHMLMVMIAVVSVLPLDFITVIGVD
jgi:hypothetical protein